MTAGELPAGLLVLKLVVTPLLIAVATLVARRWGHGVGGWLAGFPLTSAPVSIFLAVEQGPAFAAGAAVGTLLGLAAMGLSCLAYGLVAQHAGWMVSTAATVVAFVACAAILRRVTDSLLLAFLIVCGTLAAVAAALPRTSRGGAPVAPPAWDLAVRMIAATSVVLAVTAAAAHLGPTLSGLLSPLPVFLLVLAIFAQRTESADASIRVLRGGVIGSFAFAVFFLVVGASLPRLGLGATYAIASASTIAVNGAVLSLGRRSFR
ncbi:MAG TPA: hypothetical protein VMI34_09305 [Candidatus Bathyarchaeia archaeon]|nr:hypothetical protein [Candidatus Bathyarchaeia archaeon]